jgi:hypothetical protein
VAHDSTLTADAQELRTAAKMNAALRSLEAACLGRDGGLYCPRCSKPTDAVWAGRGTCCHGEDAGDALDRLGAGRPRFEDLPLGWPH